MTQILSTSGQTPLNINLDSDDLVKVTLGSLDGGNHFSATFFASDLAYAVKREFSLTDLFAESNSEEPAPEFTITRAPHGDIFVYGHGTYDGDITIEEAEREIPVSKAILEFLKNEEEVREAKAHLEEEDGVEDLAYTMVLREKNPVTVALQLSEARRLYDLGVRAPKRET